MKVFPNKQQRVFVLICCCKYIKNCPRTESKLEQEEAHSSLLTIKALAIICKKNVVHYNQSVWIKRKACRNIMKWNEIFYKKHVTAVMWSKKRKYVKVTQTKSAPSLVSQVRRRRPTSVTHCPHTAWQRPLSEGEAQKKHIHIHIHMPANVCL